MSKVVISSWMSMHNACSARFFPFVFVLSLLLSQHGLQIQSTIHEPGTRWLFQHWRLELQCLSIQIPPAAVGSRQEALVLPDLMLFTKLVVENMQLEGPGSWKHGGVVSSCVGFLENKELPPGQADVVEKFLLASQKGHAVKLHAHFVVLTSQKSTHWTVMSCCPPPRWLRTIFSTHVLSFRYHPACVSSVLFSSIG